ncbi:MAG: hypothetical protein JO091_01940 [Acidobacteriaceae bacterium]|nr:hypothetical protein [Acidobacteriaceae bacterium]
MDPGTATVIAATVTATGVIIAAVVARRKEKRTSNAEKEVIRTTRDIVADYGRQAEEAYSRMEILNLDGDSRTTMRWTGIKLSQGVLLTHLSGRVWVSTPQATIRSGPRLVSSSEFPKEISLVLTKDTPAEREYNIEIPALLTPNEPPLDFEIETEFCKSVFMYREAVDAAYSNDEFKRDYHAFDVEFPINKILLEVSFPENFPVTTFAGVFAARTENFYDVEFQRVKGGFEKTTRGGRFAITSPLVGCRYFIYWTVPPKSALPAIHAGAAPQEPANT